MVGKIIIIISGNRETEDTHCVSQDDNHTSPLDRENTGQRSDGHPAPHSNVLGFFMGCSIFGSAEKTKIQV